MAATCKTVQFVDTRIEPMPNPVYDYVIAPTQNQFYKIPASGLSNSGVNFNNLTTLGVDRAYLDTFEIELEATITFNLSKPDGSALPATTDAAYATYRQGLVPAPDEWTFQSFPFNTCCETARVNINGGTFFSEPLSYVRAKERYMNQQLLSRSYQNVCPVHRPICQTESGIIATDVVKQEYASVFNMPTNSASRAPGVPTRYGRGIFNYGQSEDGITGSFNNAILRLGNPLPAGGAAVGFENYYREGAQTVVKVSWREPIFCSPFSNRYDATYGRPLYNITSMDLYFAMQNLGNMIRLFNYRNGKPHAGGGAAAAGENPVRVFNYTIDITSANLCYQVMTIPATIQKPLSTLVPYRRFVPYITDFPTTQDIPITGAPIHINSGVYTLNEVPTAIWVFCAPAKLKYQNNPEDFFRTHGAEFTQNNCMAYSNWDSNKLFAYLQHIEVNMANTTQILNEAKPYDLYRIAKANGCEDSYQSWAGYDTCAYFPVAIGGDDNYSQTARRMFYGAGSVLRLKPGVDLIVPDIPLIPGANANNMVIQVRADYIIPPHSSAYDKWSLWLLFEYVGVASISPGQCEITMNPLGTGEIMGVSPIMSATSEATEGKLEGSGFWDGVKRNIGITAQIADDGVLSMILRRIPGAEKAAEWAKKHGLGGPGPCKRGRSADYSGGAVMGKGMDDWI